MAPGAQTPGSTRALTEELREWSASYRSPAERHSPAPGEPGPSSLGADADEDESAAFTLHLKTLDNATRAVSVRPSMRISELKLLAHPLTDLPPARQRLLFRGRELQDDQTVGAYRIEDQDVVHVIARPEGTGFLMRETAVACRHGNTVVPRVAQVWPCTSCNAQETRGI